MQSQELDTYLMRGPGIHVQFNARDSVYSEPSFKSKSGDFEFAKWGAKNQLAETMAALVAANHLKPKLLQWEVNYLYGSGLKIFDRVVEKGKERLEVVDDPEIEDWMEEVDADQQVQRAIWNIVANGNAYYQMIPSAMGNMLQFAAIDSINVRAGIIPAGAHAPTQYGILPDWSKSPSDENKLTVLPAYNPAGNDGTFMLHCREQIPGQPYYGYPVWWGTSEWTVVSNLIPAFHKAGLGNGYNIKYLIEVAESYFDNKGRSDEERAKLKLALRDQFRDFFTGTDNVDKSLMTFFGRDPAGRETPSIKISPVGDTDTDKKYLELSKLADINQVAGHGINPALAGIADGGKMGGSGSEIRLASQLHTAINTPRLRKILLQPFRIIARRNGWPKGRTIGFSDIELTTLETNPTGKQATAPNVTV